MEGNLPNWLPYLKKFVRSDCMLPESLSNPILPKDGTIALKLLHTESDNDVFILRPRQMLAMKNLKDKKLKLTYSYLKALKGIMKVDISSYSIKKVLLLEEFTQQAKTSADSSHLLYLAVSHPHLKKYFCSHRFETTNEAGDMVWSEIDLNKWKAQFDENMEGRNPEEARFVPLKRLNA